MRGSVNVSMRVGDCVGRRRIGLGVRRGGGKDGRNFCLEVVSVVVKRNKRRKGKAVWVFKGSSGSDLVNRNGFAVNII